MKCAKCGFPARPSIALKMCDGSEFHLCFDCAADLSEMILQALVRSLEWTPRAELQREGMVQ